MFKNTNNYQIKMKKRGIGHHLDWIIGISLFMLYVVFMIVTIKPGIQPLHKGDTLLSIIQDRFITNVTWNVTRVPVNIKTASCSGNGVTMGTISFPFGWVENTKVYTTDNKQFLFSISSTQLSVELVHDSNTFTGRLNVLHSDSGNFGGSGDASICSSNCCSISSYSVGIPELLTGLSLDQIEGLKQNADTNYELLKDKLNYPVTNDFNITIKGGGINREISKVAPPQNINVYVRQFPEFILENTGERIPITLTISVW